MNMVIGVIIFIVGIIGVNVLTSEAGWTVMNIEWWVTSAPLCLFTGIAAATVAKGR